MIMIIINKVYQDIENDERIADRYQDMEKEALRRLMLKKIREYPYRREESEKLCAIIAASELWKNAKTILAFSPLSSEPDISPLLQDKRILLPYIEEKEMHFSASRLLRKSDYGFSEPEHIEKLYDEALMLVPLIAFNGLSRLGRGGGYYDRYISRNHSRIVTAGVAFSVSECSSFIPDAWDEDLDVIFHTVP